jgi:8-oxo-dGTP pyrophosphatase MutT (NUDIX family)
MNYAGAGLILLSSDLTSTLLVHDTRSSKWGFPKGHREPEDVNDLQTAIRELWEETGLTAADFKVCEDSFKISKGGGSYIFRYAIASEAAKGKAKAGPANEISGIEWVPLQTLFEAQDVLDGNKYLRTWISDMKSGVSKKSVYLLKGLLASAATGGSGGSSARFVPTNESVSTNNVVTCA